MPLIHDEFLQDVSLAAATAVEDALFPLASGQTRDEVRRVIIDTVAASILIYLSKAEDAARKDAACAPFSPLPASRPEELPRLMNRSLN